MKSLLPYFFLIASQFCFASNHIMGRMVEGTVPPIGLSFWRWMGAVIILLPFTWKNVLRSWPAIRARWRMMVLIAFSLVVLGNTMIYVALNYTTAINASVIAVAQPSITFILSWIIYRERITIGQAAGAALAVVGVLTVLTRGNPLALADLDFNVGDLFVCVSTIGLSLYSILLRNVPRELSPLAMITVLQAIGATLLLPVYLWESIAVAPLQLNAETIAAALWAAVVVAILAMLLWNLGVAGVGANKASVYVYFRLLFVTIGAMLILDEHLSSYHFAAFALVVAGIWLVSRAKTQPRASSG